MRRLLTFLEVFQLMLREKIASVSTAFPQGDRHQVLQEEGAEEVTGGVGFPEAAWEEGQSGGEGG